MSMIVIRPSRGSLKRCRTVYWLCDWSFSFIALQLFSNSSNISCFTSLPFTLAKFFSISIALSTLPLVMYQLRKYMKYTNVIKAYKKFSKSSLSPTFCIDKLVVQIWIALSSYVSIIYFTQLKVWWLIERKMLTLRCFIYETEESM